MINRISFFVFGSLSTNSSYFSLIVY
uniref:Uncharacterized protein n=1 Tax=Nelumbo nucifera TaxID=4432 RepID=A0A822ZC76_NELNU|nr:TPA_asm: hypothetical protein HUJ06_015399 [Nelumbo nucifera]DAD41079.1 TPA_asm: hypothetical protein HUJ06_015402 [Nelumbo nucifera]